MLLSALFVYFRDIQPIWDVVSQVLFYASPVIIPSRRCRQKLQPGAACTCTCSTRWRVVFQQFRHAMVTHATPQRRPGARRRRLAC